MNGNFVKLKSKLLPILPTAIQISVKLPVCPKLTLAEDSSQLLFYGNHAHLLQSIPFLELRELYENYLAAADVEAFLKKNGFNTTPKRFAAALPYLVLSADNICPRCHGKEFLTKAANRSALAQPGGSYVGYVCVGKYCSLNVPGRGVHTIECWCEECSPELHIKKAGEVAESYYEVAKNEIQEYLLNVIVAYVPERKAAYIRRYANGEISKKVVEERIGIANREILKVR